MLNDFSWNMTGYIPKYQVNPHGDGIIPYVAERIFQLEPEPPAVDSLNEHILSALREKICYIFRSSCTTTSRSSTSVSNPFSVWMAAIYTIQTVFWI